MFTFRIERYLQPNAFDTEVMMPRLAIQGSFFLSANTPWSTVAQQLLRKIIRDHRHTLRKAQLLFRYILKTQF